MKFLFLLPLYAIAVCCHTPAADVRPKNNPPEFTSQAPSWDTVYRKLFRENDPPPERSSDSVRTELATNVPQRKTSPKITSSAMVCDTVYSELYGEKTPQYKPGPKEEAPDMALILYFNQEITPIISDCVKNEGKIIASLYTILTIDKNGMVIDVEFLRPALSDDCKEKLKSKFLTMTGWAPCTINGERVCSKYYFPVSGILWR